MPTLHEGCVLPSLLWGTHVQTYCVNPFLELARTHSVWECKEARGSSHRYCARLCVTVISAWKDRCDRVIRVCVKGRWLPSSLDHGASLLTVLTLAFQLLFLMFSLVLYFVNSLKMCTRGYACQSKHLKDSQWLSVGHRRFHAHYFGFH